MSPTWLPTKELHNEHEGYPDDEIWYDKPVVRCNRGEKLRRAAVLSLEAS